MLKKVLSVFLCLCLSLNSLYSATNPTLEQAIKRLDVKGVESVVEGLANFSPEEIESYRKLTWDSVGRTLDDYIHPLTVIGGVSGCGAVFVSPIALAQWIFTRKWALSLPYKSWLEGVDFKTYQEGYVLNKFLSGTFLTFAGTCITCVMLSQYHQRRTDKGVEIIDKIKKHVL